MLLQPAGRRRSLAPTVHSYRSYAYQRSMPVINGKPDVAAIAVCGSSKFYVQEASTIFVSTHACNLAGLGRTELAVPPLLL